MVVPCLAKLLYVLALGHGGPARAAREDDGLRNLRHRQLATDGRRRRAQRRDARHYLPVEAYLLANLDLLHHGPVQAGVPRMHAGNFQVLIHRPLVELPHAFERYGRRLDDLGAGPGVLENAFLDEATGPDHHVRLADEPGSPDRQQVGAPGPAPINHTLPKPGVSSGKDHGGQIRPLPPDHLHARARLPRPRCRAWRRTRRPPAAPPPPRPAAPPRAGSRPCSRRPSRTPRAPPSRLFPGRERQQREPPVAFEQHRPAARGQILHRRNPRHGLYLDVRF